MAFCLSSEPTLDDIFDESYEDESGDSGEEDGFLDEDMAGADQEILDVSRESLENEEQVAEAMMENKEDKEDKLGISEELARKNYIAAGTEVEEEKDRITVAGNPDLMNPEVNSILDRILLDLNLPYKMSDFQRVAVNCVGSQKPLVLVSPTGSGKMDVPLVSALVLRKKLDLSKGVAIVTLPLTSIMNQKMSNKICDVAVLSMTGKLTTSLSSEEDAELSCKIDDLLAGKYPVLMGHPESFDSTLGQHILRELQRLDRLILVCIDEFHQGGEGHWNSFRPTMMKRSTGLRLYGVQNCSTIAMTATATKAEIEEVVKALGHRVRPVIITSSPVMRHIKFSMIRRPSNNYGLQGTVNKNEVKNPGLLDLLDRVFLRQYVQDVMSGVAPKKAIIFCRRNGVLGALYGLLMELTQFKFKNCSDAPFVMNHSSLLPPTEKVLAERKDEISLYLSSNKMLLGIDIANIDIVIFLRPYNQVAALVQGGGRGGRKMENGMRRRVQVYQFYNSQDFSEQNKLMSSDMKRICMSEDCTRDLMEKFFVGNSEPQESAKDPAYCCHNCD